MSILDITFIPRSQASALLVADGAPVHTRGLLKKMNRGTAVVDRSVEEKIEYQYFHRAAAFQEHLCYILPLLSLIFALLDICCCR